MEEMDLGGIGRLLALTSNEEANTLACLRCVEVFGRSEVYQLAPESSRKEHREGSALQLKGRILFGDGLDYRRLSSAFGRGGQIDVRKLGEDLEDLEILERRREMIPLFLLDPKGGVDVFSADAQLSPKAGDTLISLIEGDPVKVGAKD